MAKNSNDGKKGATKDEMRAAIKWAFGEIDTTEAGRLLGALYTTQTFYKLARVLRQAAKAGLMRKAEA